MRTAPLDEYATSVAFDATGNATLRMVPYSGNLIWKPDFVSVKASSAVAEAQCRIYIGPNATDLYFIDGTVSGSTGDSTDRVASKQVDTHGNALWAVWTGGDVGATGTVHITGTEQRP